MWALGSSDTARACGSALVFRTCRSVNDSCLCVATGGRAKVPSHSLSSAYAVAVDTDDGVVTGLDGVGSTPVGAARVLPAAHEVTRATVSETPLDVAEHARLVERDVAGAVVTFAGVVRDHDHGVPVSWLEYVAHPDAAAIVAGIAGEVADAFDVDAIAVTHRVGRLEIGEVALIAAVSSAHRAEAFAATAELVERVKKRLPVWKRQVFGDGTAEWVNSP
jgi:molybdopterin synthase catalytic subunit